MRVNWPAPGRERLARQLREDELRVLEALARVPVLALDTVERLLPLTCTRKSLEMMVATLHRAGLLHAGRIDNGHGNFRTKLLALAPSGHQRLLNEGPPTRGRSAWFARHIARLQPASSLQMRKQTVIDRLLAGSVLLWLADANRDLVRDWQATRPVECRPPAHWQAQGAALPLAGGRTLRLGGDNAKPRIGGAITATAEVALRDPAGPIHHLLLVPLPAGRPTQQANLFRAADHCISGWAEHDDVYQRAQAAPIVVFVAADEDFKKAIDVADRTVIAAHHDANTREITWPGRERILFTTETQLLSDRYVGRLVARPPEYREGGQGRRPTRTSPVAGYTLFGGKPTPDLGLRRKSGRKRCAGKRQAGSSSSSETPTTGPVSSLATPDPPQPPAVAHTQANAGNAGAVMPNHGSVAAPNDPERSDAVEDIEGPAVSQPPPASPQPTNQDPMEAETAGNGDPPAAPSSDDGKLKLPFDWESLPHQDKAA